MKCKRKNDARKLSHETLEELRIRTVQRILDSESPEVLAKTLDLNPVTIYRWLTKYYYGGWDALKAKPIPGRPPKLSDKQLRWLYRTIRDNNPLQLSFPFALWTIPMVRELIRTQLNVRLSETSVGRILRMIGFSPQRPLTRAYQQDPTLVEEWKAKTFPEIKKKAKKDNALIFFGDEAGIRSDYHKGHTWALEGKTPVVESTGARFSINMLSAISNQGEFRFMLHEGNVNADVFCHFITRLAKSVDRKVFLIVDGHPIHHAKKVSALIEKLNGKVTLFFLPPYSPQLNPDELVWGNVKQRIGKEFVKTKDELKSAALSALRSLQKLPKKVVAFFQEPHCKYAA
ncbi:MAG: IS630 family transposase [Gammaproteobacteria bacterium]|nr:IS630 family transposase [Gammaproteobacteria bacterium]